MQIESTRLPPIAIRLQKHIDSGKKLLVYPKAKPPQDLTRGWINQIRATLGRIYGENTAEVNYWCPLVIDNSPQTTKEIIIRSRLQQLEYLAILLNVPQNATKVFIGHGRSKEWLHLRIFLSETLHLPCDEFNIESTAGIQTTNRIETMLKSARMAFLVMTAEDHHSDDTFHARENVIHEIGLFQARLGPSRAIVLRENNCKKFSNLEGLTTIDFPPGNIMAKSEEIRGVLTREYLL